MPEFVYALHDFEPEHEDELSFSAGERIEVLEKDDQYGDGWWQGRSLAGKIGLFPQTYTTQSQPGFIDANNARPLTSAVTPMQALEEGDEHDHEPSDHPGAVGQGVMQATLTDVQEAIEQLGTNGKQSHDDDAGRSFSFASSHGGDTTDKEEMNTDTEDGDAEDDGMDPEEWHKGARQLLAQNAQKEMEKRRSREAKEYATRPPINVEMSDESEPEDDDKNYDHTRFRGVPGIGHRQQDSVDTVLGQVSSSGAPREETVHEEEEHNEIPVTLQPGISDSQLQTPTAPASNTNGFAAPVVEKEMSASTASAYPTSPRTDMTGPASPHPAAVMESENVANTPPGLLPSVPEVVSPSPAKDAPRSPLLYSSPMDITPVPSWSAGKLAAAGALPLPNSPAPGSVTNGKQPMTPVAKTPEPQNQSHSQQSRSQSAESTIKTHPSEWSVDEVVEWLKGKGFDESVWEKFIEHEITGDVLLDLDAASLKDELDIKAFGKRKRIENAINDLRRPASINSAFAYGADQSNPLLSHSQTNLRSHLRQESSAMSSLGSPLHMSYISQGGTQPQTPMSQESSPHAGDLAGTPVDFAYQQRAVSNPEPSKTVPPPAVAEVKGHGKKPSSLVIRSSEGALKDKVVPEEDEGRDVMSEGEAPVSAASESKSKRRRVFGRSLESASSKTSSPEQSTAASSLPGSPFVHISSSKRGSYDDNVRPRDKAREKVVGNGERLSFFGGSLGKSRKPPPRFSTGPREGSMHSDETEKHQHHSAIGRLLSSGSRTSTKSQEAIRKDTRDLKDSIRVVGSPGGSTPPAVLRKKSANTPLEVASPAGGGAFPDRRSGSGGILEQIGRSDHSGWLRKKGERYNTWKLRYMVLQGPNLYYLRNDSKTETKIKGYINIQGYKVLADENVNPGRYGFRIIHDVEKPHFFSSEESMIVREWMKALMKATIGRDYSKPVVSSCNIPTIPLTVAQAMNPAPRPPSPTARDATQKALRRENPQQLTSRDAQVLMGMSSPSDDGRNSMMQLPDRADVGSLIRKSSGDGMSIPGTPRTPRGGGSNAASMYANPPPRPVREQRGSVASARVPLNIDPDLLNWANGHLPSDLQLGDPNDENTSYGLYLFRIAEDIKGMPSEPPVQDSMFPSGPNDERLDGLFKLFDMLLDEGVKMGAVSINDVRQGRQDKIVQLLHALRAWEDKQRNLVQGIGAPAFTAGGFLVLDHQ